MNEIAFDIALVVTSLLASSYLFTVSQDPDYDYEEDTAEDTSE